MIDVLQVSRHEMPEAIKTLQRALEREVERSLETMIEDVEVLSEEAEPLDPEGLSRSSTSGSSRSFVRIVWPVPELEPREIPSIKSSWRAGSML
jgi:hypothetical protein